MRTLLLPTVALFFFCQLYSPTIAQTPTISFGVNNVIDLAADTPGQTINFYATNVANMNFEGLELIMQIGDGGAAVGGTDTGPAIFTAVNLFPPNSIFDFDNQEDISTFPLAWFSTQEQFSLGEFTRDGLFAQITFDTTGIGVSGDSTPFRLFDVGSETGDTKFFAAVTGEITNPIGLSGMITIDGGQSVPEPGSLVLFAGGLIVSILRRKRRRQHSH